MLNILIYRKFKFVKSLYFVKGQPSPDKVVFVDDTEENILSAQKIGIKSILFTDAETLKK